MSGLDWVGLGRGSVAGRGRGGGCLWMAGVQCEGVGVSMVGWGGNVRGLLAVWGVGWEWGRWPCPGLSATAPEEHVSASPAASFPRGLLSSQLYQELATRVRESTWNTSGCSDWLSGTL